MATATGTTTIRRAAKDGTNGNKTVSLKASSAYTQGELNSWITIGQEYLWTVVDLVNVEVGDNVAITVDDSTTGGYRILYGICVSIDKTNKKVKITLSGYVDGGKTGDNGTSPIELVPMMQNISIPLNSSRKPTIEVDGDDEFAVHFYMAFGDRNVTSFYSLNASRLVGTNTTVFYEDDSSEGKGIVYFRIDKSRAVSCYYWEFLITGIVIDDKGNRISRSCHISFTAVSAGTSTTGTPGIQGCVVRDCGLWDSTTKYYNDSALEVVRDTVTGVRYIDAVYDSNNMYYYRNTVTDGYTADENGNYPEPGTEAGSSFWSNGSKHDLTATHVLLADNASIDCMSGNEIVMKDASNNPTAGMRGGDGVQIWAGSNSANLNDAPFRVSKDGSVVSSKFKTADSGTRMEIENGIISVFGSHNSPNIEFGVDGSGYAVLKYYDSNHNLLYNLGPEGIVSAVKYIQACYITKLLEKLSSTVPTKITVSFTSFYIFQDGIKEFGSSSTNCYTYSFRDSGWGDPGQHTQYHNLVYKSGGSLSPASNATIDDGWYIGQWEYEYYLSQSRHVYAYPMFKYESGALISQGTLYAKLMNNGQIEPCDANGNIVSTKQTWDDYV